MNDLVSKSNLIAIEKALIEGDLKPLSVGDRILYYRNVCKSLGLNEVTKPFDYIYYNNKLVLYPNKNAAEQLRSRDEISIKIVNKEKLENIFSITVHAKSNKTGREDESTAFLDITGLSGSNLANALMKAETKAKRRVTLSICSLGMIDESEWETVESAIPVQVDFDQPKKIAENLEKAKLEDEKRESNKPVLNMAPVDMSLLKRLSEKMELIQVKSNDIKSVCEQLWQVSDSKLLKVWQATLLLNLLSGSKTREEFGKLVSDYESSEKNVNG